MTATSRIPGFYKQSVADRLRLLYEQGTLVKKDYEALLSNAEIVDAEAADRLIENVIGVLALPMGLGTNFLVNGRDYVVPMVIEEPSVVAAVSSAARTVRAAGGFRVTSSDPMLIGQIQVVDVANATTAREAVLEHKGEILDLANSLHPNMVARGGGARDVEIHVYPAISGRPEMFVVHVIVDTGDAMGANLVNSMCEEVAPMVEQLTGGRVFLRILSNLARHAMAKAEAVIPVDLLGSDGYSGEEVRDGIVLANQFAEVDPYRAATHNKGIMNGIDAVALATGNDWRAIEASAHAYAALQGRYRSLTRWWKTEEGHLAGVLELPLKVGIVGGQMQSNPATGIARRILGVTSARDLAEIMAAVGLAQNFAAIRALSTDGIQRGHMSLHARSVAVAAGTPPRYFEAVVSRLIADGEIKVWKAKEILDELKQAGPATRKGGEATRAASAAPSVGHGKVILLGEHAVVYGRHALAAPVPLAMRAVVEDADEEGIQVIIPQWNVSERMDLGVPARNSLEQSLRMILEEFDVRNRNLSIRVHSGVPRAMGLGGSAALAVAVVRAVGAYVGEAISNERVNRLAYRSEQFAHGTPSGIDNSVATYGRPILFRRDEPPMIRTVRIGTPASLVVGLTRREGLTAAMVARVREGREASHSAYERIFDEIDTLTLQATQALEQGRMEELGRCMNMCHGLLNALQVSTHELERIVEIARNHGALGAKLTGAGGGGAVIALAPEGAEGAEGILQAIRNAGHRAFLVELAPDGTE
ncbi:MAG: hydroxymethylglutaryl-CoA reductase, degradative [Planctomycetota bacterium]